MIIGLLMLLVPIVIYMATLAIVHRLRPGLCQLYRIMGGVIVFGGSAISFYFAAYSGDQGGITAFYFQIVVILVYIFVSVALLTVNWFFQKRELIKDGS